jgi:hypothetical protein
MADLPRSLHRAIVRAGEPLLGAATHPIYRRDVFRALGFDPEIIFGADSDAILAALEQGGGALDRLASLDLGDLSLDTVITILEASSNAVQAADTIADRVAAVSGGADPVQIARDLLSLLTVRHLMANAPLAYEIALLATIVREPDDTSPFPRIELDRLPRLLSDPATLLRDAYFGPGGLAGVAAAEDACRVCDRMFPRVAACLQRVGLNARYLRDPRLPLPVEPAVADRMLALSFPISTGGGIGVLIGLRSAGEGGAAFVLRPVGDLQIAGQTEDWDITARLAGQITGLAIGPDGVELPDQRADIGASVVVAKRQSTEGFAFRTAATGTRLEARSLAFRVGATFGGDYDVEVACDLGSAAFVIAPPDGFFRQFLPADGLRTEFQFGVGWSRSKGFFFQGAGGLDAMLPVRASVLGVLNLEGIHLLVHAQADAITARVGIGLSFALGPVTATVDRLGARADLTFPPTGGNLGLAHADVGLQLPSGVALKINAGALTGAGVLFVYAPGQYAGAIHLQFEKIAVTAIGLLSTTPTGFSLLVLVKAEGFKPISLGYGFSLVGVGGLVGINRRVSTERLREGLRSRALDAVLFASGDIAARAPEIVRALADVFPESQGRHVFGPMAIIEWGTPAPLIRFEIALLLELPAPLRLVVLGRIFALLPDKERAVVALRMDVLGVVDLGERQVSIDAVLYDSHVAGFPVTGEMALRASWGDRPEFLLAVGGFHPHYEAPATFPRLRRMGIALAAGDNPRLTVEAYVALTANTAQIGARMDLYAEVGPFALVGALGFDTLFQFLPAFSFIGQVVALLALKYQGKVVMGAWLDFTLSGPAPWHARGLASFMFFGFTATVAFEAKFGAALPPPPPAPILVWPLLRDELKNARNWSSQLTPAASQVLVLKSARGESLVHPLASLAVTQRTLPLARKITRFGTAAVADPATFSISAVKVGGRAMTTTTRYEHFAVGQFREMSPAERLSAPSFDPMPAGIEVVAGEAVTGPAVERRLVYATHIRKRDGSVGAGANYQPPTNAVEAFAAHGAAASAETRSTGRAQYAADAPGVAVVAPTYAVATRNDLHEVRDVPAADLTYSAALDAFEALRARQEWRTEAQIVRRRELVP